METNMEQIVFNLNQDIYNSLENSDYVHEIYFEYNTNGFASIIVFLGVQIWSTEDDCREEIEVDVYEPLESFLRRKAMILLDSLKSIKL